MRPDAAGRSVLVVADSDSYLKWGAGIVSTLPSAWKAELLLLATPALPSAAQIVAALSGTGIDRDDLRIVRFAQLIESVRRFPPDAVLVSTRGPVARVLIDALASLGPLRPVIVTGLPGISIPASTKALVYRANAELFLLHSRRELREFSELAALRGSPLRFALATLPFLTGRRAPETAKTDIVFAAQAKVPLLREDRVRLLGWLVDAARQHPQHRVVLKLRARAGEQQTHRERFGYEQLLAETVSDVPQNLVVSDGPMDAQLDSALALVTVSSTAIVEAVDRGVAVLAIDDFGVGPLQINDAFVGSGLLGPSSDLAKLRFHSVEESWRDDNYFHPASRDDWRGQLVELMAERRAHGLPQHPITLAGRLGALRGAWNRKRALGPHDSTASGYIALAVGTPLRAGLLAVRRVRRRRRLRRLQRSGDAFAGSLPIVWTDAPSAEHRTGRDPRGAALDRVDQR